jgi:hypothetical protein
MRGDIEPLYLLVANAYKTHVSKVPALATRVAPLVSSDVALSTFTNLECTDVLSMLHDVYMLHFAHVLVYSP